MHNLEGEKYPIYLDFIYEVVLRVMGRFCKMTRNRRRKIKKYHKLPVEAMFIFQTLENLGFDVNEMSESDLEQSLELSFSLIDRDNKYDQELMRKVGHLETMRWRIGEDLKDEGSFYEIVKTLKKHYVAKTPLTKIAQNPKVKFVSRGDYHKKQSLG